MRGSLRQAAASRAGALRAALATPVLVGSMLAGCGHDPAPGPVTRPSTQATVAPTDRDMLAGLAAAAEDRRYVATYTLVVAKRPDRTVTVAVATDGSWIVAVPAGALGGLADVAVFHSDAGTFQCALSTAAGATAVRPDLAITPGCVAVPKLAAANDPQIQHLFTDWIDALVDRGTALSVAGAPVLPGASGSCFSVESTAAALAPPVDPGIYCYAPDGMLTAARIGAGTLTLTGPVAVGPPSVTMPAPVVVRPLLAMTAPPPPVSPAP